MQNALQLRVYGTPEAMIAVADRIEHFPAPGTSASSRAREAVERW